MPLASSREKKKYGARSREEREHNMLAAAGMAHAVLTGDSRPPLAGCLSAPHYLLLNRSLPGVSWFTYDVVHVVAGLNGVR